ncbi:hypothetical protein [Nonomuraea gerenzanensis]|uniref:Uncharacterized protein n=1 Tax=Nonomuraea gerenzanensis TaxID=93944 RepID=A0A1M4EBE2_9ACTN|nr:hypothetical protein [Nonomuraea gerenzanensis]UBU18430.1 hypothetical protein LCN96_26420 [Nonomuraea gerenzanensis]SBO96261.1 hypothetical protein BN4615_P5777 [Nonomuraea gerenzanensis]
MKKSQADIETITVDPDPVVLDRDTVVTIEVTTAGATEVTGSLEAPDGTLVLLRFDGSPDEQLWRAEHPFPAESQSGSWLLTVEVPGLLEERDLVVYGKPPPGEISFMLFDVQPRVAAGSEPVVADGFLEIDESGFGGQRVSIAFKGLQDDDWAEIGEAVTDQETGYFSAEIVPDTGEVRAELWLRPDPREDADVVLSESIPCTRATFAGRGAASILSTTNSSAWVSGRNTVRCKLHRGVANSAAGGRLGNARILINYIPPGGRARPARKPGGGGMAIGRTTALGAFAVKSATEGSGGWDAVLL